MTDPIDLRKKANQPASMTDDAGSVTQHPLRDQIAVQQFEAAKGAVTRNHMGIRKMRITPAGPVS